MSKIHELAFNAEQIDELLDSVDKKTIYQDATQSEHGLMSTTDKTKLDALPTAKQIDGALNAKVDKEEGKGLSQNDYTDADKAKVASALQSETDPTVPMWAKQENKPSYDYREIGNTPDLSDFATASQGAKADTAYQKPTTGIPESDLSSDVQQALQKHFKGWYDSSSNLPANPVVGDYAYVKGAETTDPAAIYECTTAGSWSDSGRTADTSNVQTFESGEEVNETYIDDTHLENPKDGALPTAADVLKLKAKLEGVTASESKATTTSTGTVGKYIKPDNTEGTGSGWQWGVFNVVGYKSVRFVALNYISSTTPSSGWLFLDDSDNIKGSGTYKHTAESTTTEELVIPVPEGATKFKTNIAGNALTGNFYCYLQSGESVIDMIPQVIDNFEDGGSDKALSAEQGKLLKENVFGYDTSHLGENIIGTNSNTQWILCTKTSVGSEVALRYKTNSSNFSYLLYLNNYRGKRLFVKANSSYVCYYMLFRKQPKTSEIITNEFATLDVLTGQDPYLCPSIHYDSVEQKWNSVISISANASAYIDIPDDAVCIIFAGKIWNTSNSNYESGSADKRLPSEVRGEYVEHIDGKINVLNKEVNANRNSLLLKYGAIDGLGDIVSSNKSLLTNPISLADGFFLSVKEPYRIFNCILVDHVSGQVVDEYYIHQSDISSVSNPIYKRLSRISKTPSFDVIASIVRLDGEEIDTMDNVIDEFCNVGLEYKRMMPTNINPFLYKAWKDKLQTNLGIVWEPLLKVPRSGDDSAYKYLQGRKYIGVPYSGPTQWGKHVGMEVSMRTFKTALLNKRSVMYTERIGANGTGTAYSKYGYTHASYGDEAGAFYGCVCTGLTSYMLGINTIITSSQWDTLTTVFSTIMSGSPSSETITANGNEYSYDNPSDCATLAAMLQPMDFLYNAGHCAMISDIYLDDYDIVKYIVISEQTGPVSIATAYTPEYFFLRYKNNIEANKDWKVLRKKTDWTSDDVAIPRPNGDKEYCIMDKTMYNPNEIGSIDKDITTFAGEYAVFVIGDYSDTTNNFKMFLNIHRGGAEGYTHLQIFNESDDELTATPLSEIDITTNGGNVAQATAYTNYEEDAADKEDWIVFNLAEYWRVNQATNVGKFKARVVKKSGGSIADMSGCTHFMMVGMELTYSNGTIDFTVTGATPVVYRNEVASGLMTAKRYVDIDLSTLTHEGNTYIGNDIAISSDWGSAYIRLVANTDYGTANVRVAIS